MPWIIGGAIAGGAVLGSLSAGDAADKQAASSNKAIDATTAQAATARNDLAPYRSAGTAALSRLRSLLGIQDASAGGAVTYGGQNFDSLDHLRQSLVNDYVSKGGNPNTPEYQSSLQSVLDKASPTDTSGGDLGSSPLLRKFQSSDLAADPVYNSGLQFGLDEGTKAIERRAAAGGGYDSGATLKGLTRFASDYGSTKAADSRSRFVEDQNNTFGKISGISGMGSGATTVGVNAGANSASNLAALQTGQGNASAAASIASGNALAGGANAIGNYTMQQNLLAQLQGGGARTTKAPALVGDE